MKTSPPTETEIQILLVDHDTPKRDAIRRMLGDNGFQTAAVSNRHEALEQFRETSFSLVIVNMLMPHAEGIGSLIAIGGFAPAMKIIAISDALEGGACDFLPLAKSLGAFALLADPLDPGKLVDAVHSLIDPALHEVAC